MASLIGIRFERRSEREALLNELGSRGMYRKRRRSIIDSWTEACLKEAKISREVSGKRVC